MTVFYVMFGEVLIFVPSVGQYYRELLGNHIQSAELAILPFTMPGGDQLPASLRAEILKRAGAAAVLLKRADQRQLFLVDQLPRKVDITIDLTTSRFWTVMIDGVDCLLHRGNRTLHVIAPTRVQGAESIGIILGEEPIRDALTSFAWRVMATGFFVSAVAAALLFLSLFYVFVRPMENITRAMVRFRDDPEDSRRIIALSSRRDEIGVAERELASMQRDLYSSLQQKTRLAALGSAVARIQHDLRNILANAKLASDRLSAMDDPVVKRLTPRLVTSLDRAVALATQTLRYGRAEERAPERRRIGLRTLVDEAAEAALETAAPIQPIALVNHIDAGLLIDADPEQLFRTILNLVRNAVDALGGRPDATIQVLAERTGSRVSVTIADNGPGVAEPVRRRLFQPFATSSRASGTGLGLAIARDLARLHGGEVTLLATGPNGSQFRIEIPDREDH